MNIKTLGLIAYLALAGCASPVNDLFNNKFASIAPKAAPETLVGIWSGSMGPYLTSFIFKEDGHGVFCYSWGTADVLQKVKYSNNIIYMQDGFKLEIKTSTSEFLVVNASYFGSNESIFYKDNHLKEASLFCSSKLGV